MKKFLTQLLQRLKESKVAAAISSRFEDLRASIARLSPRERVMVSGLGTSVLVLILFLVSWLVLSHLGELEARSEDIRVALKDLNRYRDVYRDYKSQVASMEARISPTPLDLNAYAEKVAASAGVRIDESSETNPAIVGPYEQRGLEIKIRKINLGQLANLLKQLEESPNNIIKISELSVTTRYNQPDELDVELTVSTFDRAKPSAKKKESKEEEQ